ncbi:30S ribosomal protein S13 [Candidatus Hodgkinia cicadicola]|nr:30S ribosomal protein S13 [Candidatus Hodgkinia cicadicola]
MYICGTHISESKPAVASLQQIYGVGKSTAESVIANLGVRANSLLRELTIAHRFRIRQIMEQQLKLGDALKQQINENITMLKTIGCYRGLRHRRNLPVRGQRTRSNARTRKHFVAGGV